MFSYDHLTAFCATAEEGSYSQAARRLGKDRTTVREQIKAIEDSYAITLFNIEGKKAVMTPQAEAFYKQAKLVVRSSEALNSHMMNSYQQVFTHFDIYHDALVPTTLIAQVESAFTQRFPHIKLNWLHRNRDEILETVSTGTHQLALMQYRLTSDIKVPYRFLNLGSESFIACCNPKHPLANSNIASIEELKLEKQYITENLYDAIPDLFGVSPDLRFVSNNDVLIELLKLGGWAILSKAQAKPYLDRKVLAEIEIDEVLSPPKSGIAFYFPVALEKEKEVLHIKEVLSLYAKKHFT
ncbi:putative Transcriptional regulator, LysR family protein [Vibrio nigripulchritudo SFn27]|uniref:Putative Transcriptional regulator, LysR family protein n=1 Tax=Vibrio nigripulchritudo TaxID=28173 RepID=U4K485_9VIBR|nr:LysR family transcriptional regulator [Vibrio nigripulchritudo]CCN85837.1 putative Transcriptional regulator, LysR family protein [Vibrio nigripulchritudo BLFn1]CCN90512.1 putative Transcriptional regulator, LysR family protein [Vibrio nigripulchritudo SFn27]CCN93631.1 putative Transcriptional regulator, LysR family protein [Vibrio nigripulchritudo ENn2]CCO42953.1 putative Transcriptional regulator, LysR family protein [Vibrio nigripulchritudo SFn135]CCO50746.1 putative Transcriptional regu